MLTVALTIRFKIQNRVQRVKEALKNNPQGGEVENTRGAYHSVKKEELTQTHCKYQFGLWFPNPCLDTNRRNCHSQLPHQSPCQLYLPKYLFHWKYHIWQVRQSAQLYSSHLQLSGWQSTRFHHNDSHQADITLTMIIRLKSWWKWSWGWQLSAVTKRKYKTPVYTPGNQQQKNLLKTIDVKQ